MDLPTLQAIATRTWGKEDELKALKSELAVLDHKITAELAPKHDEKDGEEIKRDESAQHTNHSDVTSQSIGSKDSMVAEPFNHYRQHKSLEPRIFIGGCVPTPQKDLRIAGHKL